MPHALKISVVAAFTILAASFALVSSRAGAATTPYCAITWGSLAKHNGQGPGLPPTPLSAVTAGQHSCFDRLVFTLNGPAAGYNLNYGPVLTQGQGASLTLAAAPPSTLYSTTPLTTATAYPPTTRLTPPTWST